MKFTELFVALPHNDNSDKRIDVFGLLSVVFFTLGLVLAVLFRNCHIVDFVSDLICGYYCEACSGFTEYFFRYFKADIAFLILLVLLSHFALGFIAVFPVIVTRGAAVFFIVFDLFLWEGTVASGVLSAIGFIVYLVLSSAVFIFAAGRAANMSRNIFLSLVFGRQQELNLLYGRYIFGTVLSFVLIASACAVGALCNCLLY